MVSRLRFLASFADGSDVLSGAALTPAVKVFAAVTEIRNSPLSLIQMARTDTDVARLLHSTVIAEIAGQTGGYHQWESRETCMRR